MSNTNRHPIDELADVRANIKTLSEREKILKDRIIAGLKEQPKAGEPVAVLGDENVGSVSYVETERLDRKAVEKLLTKPKFQSCLKTTSGLTIRTAPRAGQIAA